MNIRETNKLTLIELKTLEFKQFRYEFFIDSKITNSIINDRIRKNNFYKINKVLDIKEKDFLNELMKVIL